MADSVRLPEGSRRPCSLGQPLACAKEQLRRHAQPTLARHGVLPVWYLRPPGLHRHQVVCRTMHRPSPAPRARRRLRRSLSQQRRRRSRRRQCRLSARPMRATSGSCWPPPPGWAPPCPAPPSPSTPGWVRRPVLRHLRLLLQDGGAALSCATFAFYSRVGAPPCPAPPSPSTPGWGRCPPAAAASPAPGLRAPVLVQGACGHQ